MKRYLPLLFTLMISVCGSSQKLKLSNTCLWKISGNGLLKDSYIFLSGNTCQETIKLKPKVQTAINASNAIVLENNLFDKGSIQKMQRNMMAMADSQRIKNILSASQYQELVKKFKDEGAPNEAFDQLNNIKIDMLYMMRIGELSPCNPEVRIEKIEEVLKDLAEKQKKPLATLLTVDNVLAENAFHSKEYWQRNMWYAFKNEDAFRQAVQRKMDLYSSENLIGLSEFYLTHPLFQVQYSDNVLATHLNEITPLINNAVKKDATFIQVNVANVLQPQTSLFLALEKMGFTITPVLD